MPSPFPGMDPYLEAHWGDVHATLIIYAREELQRQLPSDLRARVEERVLVESDDVERRSVYPDVRIYERPRGRDLIESASATGFAAGRGGRGLGGRIIAREGIAEVATSRKRHG